MFLFTMCPVEFTHVLVFPLMLMHGVSCVATGSRGGKGEAERHVPAYREVMEMRFSFQRILAVSNLLGFDNLRKLALDNNLIERVQNVGHLKNLRWLDLSFNNISSIEGLESLTKLETLSLYRNRIKDISGLDTLEQLSDLSLGENEIGSLDTVLYLRKFPKLRNLTLKGCPVCSDGEYMNYVLAHLPSLKYIDYRMIDESARATAKQQYLDSLLVLKTAEEQQQASENENLDDKSLIKRKELYDANVAWLSSVFSIMFKEDPEFARLRNLPQVEEPVGEYRTSFNLLTVQFQDFMVSQHKIHAHEKLQFEKFLMTYCDDADTRSLVELREFAKVKKQIFQELAADEALDLNDYLELLLNSLEELAESLTSIEVDRTEGFETVMREFEQNMQDLLSVTLETSQNYVGRLRELENSYHDALLSLALSVYDQFQQGEQLDLPEDLRALLLEKDHLVSSLNTSHDLHNSKLDQFEDMIKNTESRMLEILLSSLRADEHQRSRARIEEVAQYCDHVRLEVGAFKADYV